VTNEHRWNRLFNEGINALEICELFGLPLHAAGELFGFTAARRLVVSNSKMEKLWVQFKLDHSRGTPLFVCREPGGAALLAWVRVQNGVDPEASLEDTLDLCAVMAALRE